MKPPYLIPTEYDVIHGDCVEAMAAMAECSIDAIVTDPPYGLEFMGKEFDRLGPGPKQQEWHRRWAEQALRVLKPGGYLLAFGGTRTYHRLACAVEDAGFEIRDQMQWLYGSGFPKSLDVSKAIDKAAGAEREVVGSKVGQPGYCEKPSPDGHGGSVLGGRADGSLNDAKKECEITAPATDSAKHWDGWGTALKPAHEPVVLARKPLSEKTVAANVLKHGTGGINVGACRIETSSSDARAMERCNSPGSGRLRGRDPVQTDRGNKGSDAAAKPLDITQGRWPANVVMVHHPECECVGTKKVKGTGPGSGGGLKTGKYSGTMGKGEYTGTSFKGFADEAGNETVEEWNCHPECPVRMLDEQSGPNMHGAGARRDGSTDIVADSYDATSYMLPKARNMRRIGDTGGASRFFMVLSPSCGDELIEEESMSAGRRVASNDDDSLIAGSGNRRMDLSQMDTKSIIETKTSSTTISQTSNVSPPSGTTTTTREREKTISSSKVLNTGVVRNVQSTDPSIPSSRAAMELSKGIVSSVPGNTYASGVPLTENDITPTCVPIDDRQEDKNRFFYTAKASRSERNAGLPKGMKNNHPTVKPVDLMAYLCRLVTPPGGTVLDPFCGSGTTGIAARLEGFHFMGIEQDAEYAEVARVRIDNYMRYRKDSDGKPLHTKKPKRIKVPRGQMDLL